MTRDKAHGLAAGRDHQLLEFPRIERWLPIIEPQLHKEGSLTPLVPFKQLCR